MFDFLFTDTWVKVADTAWFQIILAAIAGALAASTTFWYTKKLEVRREATEKLAIVFSKGRLLRDSYFNFLSYDTDFKKQQGLIAKATKNQNQPAIDSHIMGAQAAQATSLSYKQQFERVRADFIGASFVVFQLLTPRLKDTDFFDWTNRVAEITNKKPVTDLEFNDLKKEIDAQLLPILTSIEMLTGRILWELRAPWYSRLHQRIGEWFIVQKDLLARKSGDKT